jgi:hypothetical protein
MWQGHTHTHCRCGKNISADPYHHLNCNLNSGMITLRHNRLVQTLSDIAKLAGAATSIEPRVPHTNSIRPDLTIALDGLFYSVDVSVVNPLAPSFLRTAKRHSLAVAEIKAKQKKTKYSEQAKSWNAAFFPFASDRWLSPRCSRATATALRIPFGQRQRSFPQRSQIQDPQNSLLWELYDPSQRHAIRHDVCLPQPELCKGPSCSDEQAHA